MFIHNLRGIQLLHGDGILLGDGVLAEVGVMTIGHLVSLLGVHPGRSYAQLGPGPRLELIHHPVSIVPPPAKLPLPRRPPNFALFS